MFVVSWHVFSGWTSKHQTVGWEHIWSGGFERGSDIPLNCFELSGALFRSYWPRWKSLEVLMTHSLSKRLYKTLLDWQNINQNPRPSPLTSAPSPARQGQDDNDGTGSHSDLPLQHHEWKWNWFENPTPARSGTEGIIVLIVLMLCPLPPP